MNASSSYEALTLQQLRYFVAVAEAGSFSRADQVRRSQPAISRGIKALEEILGAPLFDDGYRKKLTPLGKELFVQARRVLGETETFSSLARDASNTKVIQGRLEIGAKHSLAATMLLTMMAELRKTYPRLEVKMRSKDGSGLLKLLLDGGIELAFSHERTCPEEVEFLPLYHSRRMILAPAGHAILKVKRLTAAVLARYPIILSERGSRTARELLAALSAAARGRPLNIPIEVMGTETRAVCVREGWGIAISEEDHPQSRTSGLISRPIPEDVLPARAVGIYSMKDRPLSRGARVFLELCSSGKWSDEGRIIKRTGGVKIAS